MFKLSRIVIATLLLLLLASPVAADLNSDLSSNHSKQQQLQNLINQSKGQENTLNGQIAVFDNQIQLAQLQVDAKQTELDDLNNNISALSSQIGDLQARLLNLSKVAVARFRIGEAQQNAAPIETMGLTGDVNLSSLNLALEQYIQHKDKVVFQQMLDLKKQLGDKRVDLQTKQAAVSKAKDALDQAKADLDSQKQGKVQLLRSTQNDESRYQAMLNAAKKEEAQIMSAFNNKGGSRWVHRGDVIGTEGCTGYCFGAHLHFALYPQPYNFNKSLNPCIVISCIVQGDTGRVKSGKYLVPLHWSGTDYSDVSQWYGWTWFAKLGGYNGGIHTGVDMYTYQGDLVYAASDGMAYFSRGGQSAGNGVFIYHPDGNVTLYWHLN